MTKTLMEKIALNRYEKHLVEKFNRGELSSGIEGPLARDPGSLGRLYSRDKALFNQVARYQHAHGASALPRKGVGAGESLTRGLIKHDDALDLLGFGRKEQSHRVDPLEMVNRKGEVMTARMSHNKSLLEVRRAARARITEKKIGGSPASVKIEPAAESAPAAHTTSRTPAAKPTQSGVPSQAAPSGVMPRPEQLSAQTPQARGNTIPSRASGASPTRGVAVATTDVQPHAKASVAPSHVPTGSAPKFTAPPSKGVLPHLFGNRKVNLAAGLIGGAGLLGTAAYLATRDKKHEKSAELDTHGNYIADWKDYARGVVAPGWMRSEVAKSLGGNLDTAQKIGHSAAGYLRGHVVRRAVEGSIGESLGEFLAGRKGAIVGNVLGQAHGLKASLRNQMQNEVRDQMYEQGLAAHMKTAAEKLASTRLGRENLAKYVAAMGKAKTEGIAQAALHGGDKVLVGAKMPVSKTNLVNQKAYHAAGEAPQVDKVKLGIDSVKARMRGRMPDGSIPKGMINTKPATPKEIGDSLRGDTMSHLQRIAAK